MSSPRVQKLLEKAKTLPRKPGCYLMKNRYDDVIYVGKAKSLKNRVSSYFQKTKQSPKTEILVGHVTEFDFMLTGSEAEALVLENNLIKKHGPKYNIRLRDDKTYPYVIVDWNEPFPRLVYTRRLPQKKKVDIFGPFVEGSHISQVIRFLTKAFGLRDCSLREFHSRKNPCLLYQMHQCSAPCVDSISQDAYKARLQTVVGFFKGNIQSTLDKIEAEMHSASEQEAYERAASLRDSLELLKEFSGQSQQKLAEMRKSADVDIVHYSLFDQEVDMAIYMIRNGLLLGHKTFHFQVLDQKENLEEEVSDYLFRYYMNQTSFIPEKIIVPFKKSIIELWSEAFTSLEMTKVKVSGPGTHWKKMSDLTRDYIKEEQEVRLKNKDHEMVGLTKLQELLKLKERPVVLECYDVAIWQGKDPTASQIVFADGRPVKSDYRHYHLKELPEGNNDFAMMKEVLSRRLKHGQLPDVFIVDGGKGQVSSFQAVLFEMNIELPVVGIAKDKTKSDFSSNEVKKTQERLVIPGRLNPYLLKNCPPLMRIIVQMRDEAHRFSRRLHHKKQKGDLMSSWLDLVPGVGPKTKEKILLKLNWPVNELKTWTREKFCQELEIKPQLAQKIVTTLQDID